MANKTIGHINYSLALRPTKPGDADSPKKVFASIQVDETVTLDMLAAHMADHNTPFTKGTILGVLKDAVHCTTELMRQGKAVSLDGLATFYPKAKCQPSDSVQEFNPSTDMRLGVRVSVDSAVASALNTDIDYEYVMTREEQSAAKKAAKATLPQREASESGTDGSGNTGGSGSGNTDGSGSDNTGGSGTGGNDDNAEGQTE